MDYPVRRDLSRVDNFDILSELSDIVTYRNNRNHGTELVDPTAKIGQIYIKVAQNDPNDPQPLPKVNVSQHLDNSILIIDILA